MDRVVSIDEDHETLDELVTEATDHPVYLQRRSDEPTVAVLLGGGAFERLIDRIEDLEDVVAVLQARANPDTIPFKTDALDDAAVAEGDSRR